MDSVARNAFLQSCDELRIGEAFASGRAFMNESVVMRAVVALSVVLTSAAAVAQQSELEEVVVSAERRDSDLQSTPIAVSALGANDLERLQVTSIDDLDAAVPSLAIETNVASNAAVTVTIRGNAEQNAAFLFSEPGVGLYMNGVYRRLSGANIELADIERIEVLRGPQGTLYGRNTLAGAINVVTRAPSGEFRGAFSLGYGSENTTRAKVSLSGPLADGVNGSLSVLHQQRRDGWMTNRVDGNEVGTNKFLGALGSLSFGGEQFDGLLTVYASKHESDGVHTSPVNVLTAQRVFGDESDVASAPITLGGQTVQPFTETQQRGADLIITVPVGGATLKSISAYSTLDDDWAVDFTAAQLAAPPPMGPFDPVPGTSGFFRIANAEQKQFSQEVNLTWDGDKLDTILGVYYYREESDQLIQDYFAGGFFPGVPADHSLESKSFAVFAQANYQFADRWTAIVGGRFNDDTKELTGIKGNAAFAPTAFGLERSFSEFTAKLGLEFAVNDDLFTYATWSQGYKAGTYDPFASAETIAQGLDEETADSLEVGVKIEALDKTLRLNSALFFVRYQDLAIGTITPAGIAQRNAGESEVKGLEAELTWLANDRFTLYGTVALLDGEWRSLAPEALLTGVSLDDVPPFNFDVQATVGATYTVPLQSGALTFGASARYIDDYYQQVAHLDNPLDRVESRSWVDANVAFESSDGRHRVVLNGKNLTDEQNRYSTLNFSTFLFNNTAAWLPGESRMWELLYTYSLQ
jgi:iron complex outermembrane receptor protein